MAILTQNNCENSNPSLLFELLLSDARKEINSIIHPKIDERIRVYARNIIRRFFQTKDTSERNKHHKAPKWFLEKYPDKTALAENIREVEYNAMKKIFSLVETITQKAIEHQESSLWELALPITIEDPAEIQWVFQSEEEYMKAAYTLHDYGKKADERNTKEWTTKPWKEGLWENFLTIIWRAIKHLERRVIKQKNGQIPEINEKLKVDIQELKQDERLLKSRATEVITSYIRNVLLRKRKHGEITQNQLKVLLEVRKIIRSSSKRLIREIHMMEENKIDRYIDDTFYRNISMSLTTWRETTTSQEDQDAFQSLTTRDEEKQRYGEKLVRYYQYILNWPQTNDLMAWNIEQEHINYILDFRKRLWVTLHTEIEKIKMWARIWEIHPQIKMKLYNLLLLGAEIKTNHWVRKTREKEKDPASS